MHHQTIQDIFADENGELLKELQKKKLTVEGHKKKLYTIRYDKKIRFYHFDF